MYAILQSFIDDHKVKCSTALLLEAMHLRIKIKIKQSQYTPRRRFGGEEV
jgi:hypothetical protein